DRQRDRVPHGRPSRQQPEGVDAVRGSRVRGAVSDEAYRRRLPLGAGPADLDERVDVLQQREQRGRLLSNLGQEYPLRTVHRAWATGSARSASATWQATWRRRPISRRSGVTVSHSAIAYGQRARKRQPSFGLTTF